MCVVVCVFIIGMFNVVNFIVRMASEAMANPHLGTAPTDRAWGLSLSVVNVITVFTLWHKMKYGW